MTDLIGRLIDHYRLEAMIGDGGMGTVYRSYDLNLERPVALKIMHPHYARRPEFRARLRQEAKTLASLDHPSIVRVLDYGEERDVAYIAMEYISGGSLRAHLQRLQQRQQFLPLEQSLQIGFQIAEALHYAHQRGLIHRDVKPSNIILKRLPRPDEPGEQPFRAVLTDFGLVKLLQGDRMTQSGTTLGTPAYMSPEQCEGQELDGRSDIYSLGVVLYELLTNRLPFHFNSLAEAIAAHMRGDMPKPVREWRADIPSVVESLVERSLSKSPEERFVHAGAMATDLRSAILSMSDMPTQVLPGVGPEMHTPGRAQQTPGPVEPVDTAPAGYRLIIETPGYETTEVALVQPQISLGRDADNDVVLPAEGVSRYHARLQATTAGWSIVDLGGVNGTRLNGERIQVGQAVTIHRDDTIQVGPYQLTLAGPPEAEEPGIVPVAERSTPAPQVRMPESPLALFLARDRVAVGPGEQAEFHLEVANRGSLDDRITIDVEGLPEGWVQAPMEFIAVRAGETTPLSITLRPPRHATTPAGRQRFRIRLRSQRYPEAAPAVTASLMLGALESFEAGINPPHLRVPGIVEIMIRNTGNAAALYSVVGQDPESRLQFHGEQGRVRLEPQQRATIELEVEPRDQRPFTATEAYPFGVEVASRSGARQVLAAEADIPPLVPPWLAYSVLALVIFLCAFSALFLTFGDRQRGAPATRSALTATAVAAFDLQTIVAATATIDAATRLAITPTTTGDSDNDGLSDAQEAVIGTDPQNPDTDGDGLLDGPEVLEHGCDPLRRDTDSDFLNDWDEVNIYGTDCNNPDTDGDGIPDGLEVMQGTDPLVPETATATPSPSPPPTQEVTPSATPEQLPTPTATTEVTATPTQTATGTPQPTDTAEPTATQTPTLEPTMTSTATQMPTPFPQTSCVPSPPTIDGNLQDQVWAVQPPVVFTDSSRTMQIYLLKDAENLYQAFVIEDASVNQQDAIRIYYDVNRNQGDPDDADRMIELFRDGTLNVYKGIGSNVDNQAWEALATDTVVAGTGEPTASQWSAELAIQTVNGLMSPSNPYGMMIEFLFEGDPIPWPQGANTVEASTWSPIDNANCP